MTVEQEIFDKQDELMVHVGDVADNLARRTKKIDFTKDELSDSDFNDLKLHLGYTRTYADMARLKLHYRHNLIQEKLLANGMSLE